MTITPEKPLSSMMKEPEGLSSSGLNATDAESAATFFGNPLKACCLKNVPVNNIGKPMAHEYLNNVSNKTIAREFSVSESTVERIIHERFQRTIKQALSYPAPLMIGIDEHSIHRGEENLPPPSPI